MQKFLRTYWENISSPCEVESFMKAEVPSGQQEKTSLGEKAAGG